ncbi:pentapeptide repeat-containing protein [Amycolatopsis sp. FBCC-B4732]|uniref:pentapeptide repeat-containing protein n=1 Tax=Amycolatopsis sp. FBCC-B4732 TaxID=3079339 RepID=UPI001FF4344C|nr:pentapeptide repeat-containing protein [Amycolatopsis sp. FBCC-B4732]UOX89754.1 pentapeptide repeat-containing protein [Amycolatopsis sp. FBCC-B4732]
MVSSSSGRKKSAIPPGSAGAFAALVGATSLTGWVEWKSVWAWVSGHVVPLTTFTVAAVLISLAVVRALTDHRHRDTRRDVPPLTWWMLAGAVAVVATVTWIATSVLLNEADRANDRAAARVDAVKTGLGVAAGTGGIFALLLAVRRQWHQEFTTLETARDAESRRITELYTKSAEQLGSEKAAVRLAGLYALERLADDNAHQRQTIVNVVCAYLRMPPEATATPSGDRADDRPDGVQVGEAQIRLQAQRILARHLKERDPAGRTAQSYWREIDVDLTGATLVDLDLSGCHPRSITVHGARLTGSSDLSAIAADDVADFSDAEFQGTTSFRDARFPVAADFSRANFRDTVDFDGSQFGGMAKFTHCHLEKKASFSGVVITSDADFREIKSRGFMDFGSSSFGGTTDLRQAQIQGAAAFREAVFLDDVLAQGAHFASSADFGDAHFNRTARFDGVRFNGRALFGGCSFAATAGFEQARFNAEFTFRRVKSESHAKFAGSPWVRTDVAPSVQRTRFPPKGFRLTEVTSAPRSATKGDWARMTEEPDAPQQAGTPPEAQSTSA